MANTLDIKANINVLKDNIQSVVEEAIKRAQVSISGGDSKGKGKEGKDAGKIPNLLDGILKGVAPIAIILKVLQKLQILELITGLLTFLILFLLKPFLEEAKAFWTNILQPLLERSVELFEQFRAELPAKIDALREAVIQKFDEKISELTDIFNTHILPVLEKANEIWTTDIAPRLEALGTLLDVKLALLDPVVRLLEFVLKWVTIAGEFLGNVANEFLGPLLGDLRIAKFWLINIWNSLVEWFKRTVEKAIELKDKVVEWFSNLWNTLKELPARIWDFLKQIPEMIIRGLAGILGSLNPFAGGSAIVTGRDMILRPDGTIVHTDPNDTIIATLNPQEAGGGGNTFIFNGLSNQEMIDLIKRELGTDQFRAGRF